MFFINLIKEPYFDVEVSDSDYLLIFALKFLKKFTKLSQYVLLHLAEKFFVCKKLEVDSIMKGCATVFSVVQQTSNNNKYQKLYLR